MASYEKNLKSWGLVGPKLLKTAVQGPLPTGNGGAVRGAPSRL
jgi:hypothetical protein